MDSHVPCLSNGNKHHTEGVSNLRAKPGTVELFASAQSKDQEHREEHRNIQPQQNKTLQSLASNKKFSSMRRQRTPPDTEWGWGGGLNHQP